ncbi:hypothetical protein Cadr_000006834 [Camelus dromedarius]|uniref:Uncharacterized protein n=1 Tax=Camelus dromedarius TaxID=9838 RepID=A0A5N4E7Z2_CAMDR|nr:hypothetical protein Cadr_000006834 [Camelus dromedarius]
MAQRRIVRDALNTHGLARNHVNNGSITRFQELGTIFQLFPRMTVNLLLQFSKLASNVSCVTIQYRCISSTDLAWMVQDNHLSCEASCFHWWIIFAVTSHIATMNILDRHVLDVEAHVVPSLHSTHRNSTSTTNLVDILEGQTQGLVSWLSWWQDAIQSLKQHAVWLSEESAAMARWLQSWEQSQN